MKFKSIRTKLLAILLPLILAVVALLAGTSYYLSRQALSDSVDATARAVGTDYSKRVEADVELMLAELQDLASTSVIRSGTDKGQVAALLGETHKRLDSFDVLGLVAPDGMAVLQNGSTSAYGDRDYFKKVLATKKPVVSDPIISKSTGKLAVVLAVPAIANGQVTGVVIATFSVERLSNMIKDLHFLDSGYGQLADNSGIIIAHPKRPDLIGKLNLLEKKINPELKLAQSELDERLTNLFKTAAESGKQTRGLYRFVDGVDRIAVCTVIDLPGDQRWVLTVAAPEAEATREIANLTKAMFIIVLVCLAIASVAIVIIAKQIASPIAAIRDECVLLAQGDLRKREATISSADEIGQLAHGFREMRDHLHELIATVHSQSEQLAASSQQLTASANQSAEAANQIAVSITEVAQGAAGQTMAAGQSAEIVEQMSVSIRDVFATSSEVAGQSAQAAAKADTGSQSIYKAIEQMTKIEQTVNTSASVVAELGERSREIGQIVEAISGIAAQTNLLALNAAIEAARAGEQGRGFAVVAEEVRKLAEQSQQETKQIAELVSQIQEQTNNAVAAMTEGTQEVKMGAEVVQGAGVAFQEIVDLVTGVSGQIQQISAKIEHMAASSQHIVESVYKIDDLSKKATNESQSVSAATEEQSASVQEIAASSQSLSSLAMELREAVAKFKI